MTEESMLHKVAEVLYHRQNVAAWREHRPLSELDSISHNKYISQAKAVLQVISENRKQDEFMFPYSEVSTDSLEDIFASLEKTYTLYKSLITGEPDDVEGIYPFYGIMRAIEEIKKELRKRY